ncbi:MAG: glycosyltransferase family 2 protein [Defluviitaleaceae bacterium]|nr:glycosyltransferase family 2 protein [Defluviitaleaceae bacterium]
MNLMKKVGDIAAVLGVKKMLLPVYDRVYRKKTLAQMEKYDRSSTQYGLNTEKRDYELVVSFTTFPARIDCAAYVADSMLRQTLKPDRVILNLAECECPPDKLPQEYANLQARGLTLNFTENLGPHKKYLFAMRDFPDSIVVTVDDDVFYPENLLETLFKSYRLEPSCVSAIRAHRMLFKKKRLLPYNSWAHESFYSEIPQYDLFATGVGGVLYPPKCMHEDLFDIEAIKKVALAADDVWLKFMQLKKQTPVVVASLKKTRLLYVPSSQEVSLWSENRDNNRNDRIIKDCMELLGISAADLVDMLGFF